MGISKTQLLLIQKTSMKKTLLLAVLLFAPFCFAAPSDSSAKPAEKEFFTPEQDKEGLRSNADIEAKLPNVLILGDSISIGYTLSVRKGLEGVANVVRPKANCGDTLAGIANIETWLGDTKWDVIHFNWGLHDAKLPPEGVRHAPPEVYEQNLRRLVTRLRATGAKLVWATTTPVPLGGNLAPNRRFGSVDSYNAIAARVMAEFGVVTNDLNAAIAPRMETLGRPKDVHFTAEGSAVLAAHVARSVAALLPAR